MQDGLIQIAFTIITVIANRRGLNDAAAVGIVEKFISFVFLVPSSMLSTVSALGAQNIGAGKPERARQTLYTAIAIAAGFGLVIALLIQQIAEPVVALFTNAADSAGTSGMLCSPESIFASAAISVRAVAPSCRFCTTFRQSLWCGFRACISRRSGIRIPCSPWGSRRPAVP